MKERNIFITISHLDDFNSAAFLKPGDLLTLKKDRNNLYDDEAIVVLKDQMKCGYVANSVYSVMRGTCSAGRVYDQIKDDALCIIRFMNQELLIAQIAE
ncbi:MAG: DNA-binding protein [Erysipelotrichaceae bacterium]|nr:DNA-binding protein [Erysipelotrichaceae bacterium]